MNALRKISYTSLFLSTLHRAQRTRLICFNNSAARFLLSIAVVACCLFAGACGKRRPPLPPIERVPQRTELLSGAQQGNQVVLSWPAPQRNAADQSVQSIRRIDVFRLAEQSDAPLPLTEEEFSRRSTLIGSVDFAALQNATDTLTYTDTLELAGEKARLRYALRYVNASGQRAAFSNFLLIEPAARIAGTPALNAPQVLEAAVVLQWQAPAANIDNSTPVNLLGYNLYRSEKSQAGVGQTPLNTALISANTYADKTFRFNEQYDYVVRSVSLGTGGAQIESLNSNTVTVTPRDVFKPSAPTSLSIAAAPNRLSLFFPANPERDVAGYNVYRTLDPSLPKERWTRLTQTLLTRTTFQDETVESGKKYFYYLTAVDTSGNESAPSEAISESVP